MLSALLDGVRQLAFPDNCFLCRNFAPSVSLPLCPSCLDSIPKNRHIKSIHARRKGQCFHFDQALSACIYGESLARLLHAFKYDGKTFLRRAFLPLLTDCVESAGLDLSGLDLVCPVPLHPLRQRERGYNQAELLAVDLCRHYKRRHDARVLVRARITESQTEFDAKARWTNLAQAFKIHPSRSVAGQSVLLVDDLMTTGATADAAAAALKDAGAAYVAVLTLGLTE